MNIRVFGFLCATLVAIPCSVSNPYSISSDPRAEGLADFFQSYDCPEPFYVSDYLKAADAYNVDYRLLPVISILESTCGKYQRYNNHWGWNSTRTKFSSVPNGIDFVTKQLANGVFEGESVDQKLFAYNPRASYVTLAQKLLSTLTPDSSNGASD